VPGREEGGTSRRGHRGGRERRRSRAAGRGGIGPGVFSVHQTVREEHFAEGKTDPPAGEQRRSVVVVGDAADMTASRASRCSGTTVRLGLKKYEAKKALKFLKKNNFERNKPDSSDLNAPQQFRYRKH